MIPQFELGDVLPPFVGQDVTGGAQLPRSPYLATGEELVQVFCSSPERAAILRGFFGFRAALRAEGLTRGLQWVDGSFVENCEALKGRPPADVDVLSLIHRPDRVRDVAEWTTFVGDRRPTLFDSQWCRNTFSCDSYYVDLDAPPQSVAEQAAYWFGLFSHQRDTFRWKGLVQLPLDVDDGPALDLIGARGW
jgi:hypothetical protein